MEAPNDPQEPPASPLENQAEAAAALNVTTRTLRRWLRDGCPGRGPAGYDIDAIRAWRLAHRDIGADPLDEDLAESKRRRLVAEANRAELDARIRTLQLEQLKGGWMRPSEVLDGWAERVVAVRRACQLIVTMAAPQLVGVGTVAAAVAIVERHVLDRLGDLAAPDLLERLDALEKRQSADRPGRRRPVRRTR